MAQINLNLPAPEKRLASALLDTMVHKGIVNPCLVTSDTDGNHYYPYQRGGISFQLEENLRYVTTMSPDATTMPQHAPLFYRYLLRRGRNSTLNNMWLTWKKSYLEHMLEGPSFTLQSQFETCNVKTKFRLTEILTGILTFGALAGKNLMFHESQGIFLVFNDGTVGERLKNYIYYSIGRGQTLKPKRMDEFFECFVIGSDVYELICPRVLALYVPENETPRRKQIIAEYPLNMTHVEQALDEYKGLTYAKVRKAIFYLNTIDQDLIKICPDTNRVIYQKLNPCWSRGSEITKLMRWYVNSYVEGGPVPRDALTFYVQVNQEIKNQGKFINEIQIKFLSVHNFPEGLLGKNILAFLERMSDSPPEKRRAVISNDSGRPLVFCKKCDNVFGAESSRVRWHIDTMLSDREDSDTTVEHDNLPIGTVKVEVVVGPQGANNQVMIAESNDTVNNEMEADIEATNTEHVVDKENGSEQQACNSASEIVIDWEIDAETDSGSQSSANVNEEEIDLLGDLIVHEDDNNSNVN